MSKKKRAALKGPVFSTIRKKPRSKSEFARIYGSRERVLFVKGLPCSACGVVGYSENAHVPPKGEAGTGYKADYRFIAPLCGPFKAWDWPFSGDYVGCHNLHDEHREMFNHQFPDFDAEKAAAETQKLWLASQEGTSK